VKNVPAIIVVPQLKNGDRSLLSKEAINETKYTTTLPEPVKNQLAPAYKRLKNVSAVSMAN
jgi:hypothetical protein